MDSLLSFLSSLRKNVSLAHTKRGNRDINAAKRGKHTNLSMMVASSSLMIFFTLQTDRVQSDFFVTVPNVIVSYLPSYFDQLLLAELKPTIFILDILFSISNSSEFACWVKVAKSLKLPQPQHANFREDVDNYANILGRCEFLLFHPKFIFWLPVDIKLVGNYTLR